VIGDGLDPAYVTNFAMALGTMAEGASVVLARDGRTTGSMLHQAVVAGLMSVGCRILDAGIASTPTCGVIVDDERAAGGLQITASHNPVEWNGLKPSSNEGSVFNEALGRKLIELLDTGAYRLATWDKLGSIEVLKDPSAAHLNRVLSLINVDRIRSRKLHVVLDCNHGSGSVLGPRMLETIGCRVDVLGGIADGRFEHSPEPLKENLTALCETVKRLGADVGFAQDPDADRLAIVDNTGRYIGEELTLALCADHVLAKRKGPVVVNGSTSRATADIAEKHGCPFHRSYVGEAHVVAKMKSVGAVLGGEGNGGVIEPKVGLVRDSFVSMAYVLDGLAGGKRSVEEWVDSLPKYAIIKDKLTCPRERVGAASAALRSAFAEANASEGDGLRLDWTDRWVQVRASNTEPILRVIAEAPDDATARTLCDRAMEVVRDAVSK
jgi:phosphomannomutase